jgi:hydroxyethylthiazole kinase
MKVSVLLEKVRLQKPLVHHLTNWVTIYDCANVVKAFGASPVMAHAKEEVSQMSALASSLVLNIGTLTDDFVQAMIIAAVSANKKNIPVVLDACGAGATKFRNDKVSEIIKKTKINILKGNASEISSVAGLDVATKGVDSTDVEADLMEVAKGLAKSTGAIIVITGKTDIIASDSNIFKVDNGHEMMSHVVGTGCMAASVIGTFAAVCDDYAQAAAAGLCAYGIAAEQAAEDCKGPADFKAKLFDCIFNLDAKAVDKMQRICR